MMRFDRQPYSLRRRLLIFLLLPLSGIGLAALFDASRSAEQTANEVYDRVLSGSALAIAERVFVNEEGRIEVDIPYVALDMLTSAAEDRVFYRLEAADQTFVTGYEALEIPSAQNTDRSPFFYSDSRFRNAPIRMAVYTGFASTGTNSISYRIAVAETTNARDALAGRILLRTAFRQFILISSAVIIVWFAVTRSLRPLGRVQKAVGRRSPDDLRPIEHYVPTEISGLVDNLNRFMGRLDTALNGLRRFTGNASHQLRTPLAIIRTQLTLAQRAQSEDERERAIQGCDEAVSDAERTLSQLLLLARVDEASSKSLLHDGVDLSAVSRKTVGALVIVADKAGYDLGFEGEDNVCCAADPILLREMISNLIDNAIKHAEGGDEITVRTRNSAKGAVLIVEDNGCGIAPERRARVINRFEQETLGHGVTSGLGLSIVAEIARLFDAQLKIDTPASGRGTAVTITFKAKRRG